MRLSGRIFFLYTSLNNSFYNNKERFFLNSCLNYWYYFCEYTNMKLFYFLCFASTLAFGQVNTEKIIDISWYPTSREGTKTVYSSVKSHKKSNYFIKFKSDKTFIVPNAARRRCPTGEKRFSEGT